MTSWLDSYQQRHRRAGFPLAVAYKFVEDQGAYLAALMAFYGFLSLFPLLLLLSSILGFLLQDNEDLRRQVLDSALSQFPIIGDELSDPQGLQGSLPALIIGGLLALYGALGFAQAMQNTMNVAWSIPRNRRPNLLRARLRSLLLIALVGVAVVVTTALSALADAGDGAALLQWRGPVVLVAGLVVNVAVFLVAFRIATARPVTWRDRLPGALVAALIWQLLQLLGTGFVTGTVRDAGDTYGVFALVLGLLAWIFLAAFGVVVGVEINVVRAKRLYPRALMTLFTDDVDLTSADQQAYSEAARAQRHKGFESVDVSFEHEGQNASARRREADADDRADHPATRHPATRHSAARKPPSAPL